MKISDIEGSYMESYEAGYTNGEDVFADIHNLDHCIKYLNQSLVDFGFPSGINLYSNDPVSIANTCNSLYAMIQQRQRDIEYREAANEARQRLVSDMSRLETRMERLSDQLSIKERELQILTSKEQKITATLKTQLDKLQQEKDEIQRMLIGVQQIRSQQNHQLKKKEKEYVQLQERLNQIIMEKKKESKNTTEIINLLQKEGRQRGTWNAKKADGDFYKMVDAYESKKQEIAAENADLRALLGSMQAGMRDSLNASNSMNRPGSIANGSADLQLPLTPLGDRIDTFDPSPTMSRDQIERSLREKMYTIKELWMQLHGGHKEVQNSQKESPACGTSVRELRLEEQFAENRSILDEQAAFATKHVSDSVDNSGSLYLSQQSEEAITIEKQEDMISSEDVRRQNRNLVKSQQELAAEQLSPASTVTLMAPGFRGDSKLLDHKKQDESEATLACPELLINDKEPAGSRTLIIAPENKISCLLDTLFASQNSEVESSVIDFAPPVEHYENPWLDPLIWEKICAPIENVGNQEEDLLQLRDAELNPEAPDRESRISSPQCPVMLQCTPRYPHLVHS